MLLSSYLSGDFSVDGYSYSRYLPTPSPSGRKSINVGEVHSSYLFYICILYRDCQEEGTSGSGHDESNFSSVERMRDMCLQPHGIGFHPSNVMVKNSLDGGVHVDDGCAGTDAELIGMGNCLYEENENTRSRKREMEFWLPPETEDQENDMEGSVANYDDDDDDECDDGTKWGKPSSLSSFGVQGSGNYRYKEEKQKALDEVMNRKFRALVDHLLKSTGVASSDKDGDNWVDIVTSLSWEAALFVKPNTGEGKAMDPDGYVKVKCVATGCRSER